jgi:hypothetical protein
MQLNYVARVRLSTDRLNNVGKGSDLSRAWQSLVLARCIAYEPLMTDEKRRLGRDAQRDRFNQRAREREQEAAPKALSDDIKLDAMVKKSIADHGA